MDSNNNIHEAAEFCRTLFNSVTLTVAQKDPDRVAFLRSAQTDFNLWCSAIKATSTSKDSLDYRLRNHEDVRKAICNLLSGLKASLEKYGRSVVCSLEDHTAAPDSPSSSGSYVSWEAISEEAGSEDVSTDGQNALPDANPFVAESVLFITTTLDQLARFSLAIRKAGNKFRFARVDKELKANSLELTQFRDHLTLVILKGFPDPDPEAPLEERIGRASDPERLSSVQQRLIDANILRRHRIEYITKSRRGEHIEQRSLPKEGDLRKDVRVFANVEGPRPVPVARSIISQGSQVSSIPQPEKQMVHPAARTATDIESRMDVGGSPSHPVKSTVTNLTRVARAQSYPRSPESRLCPYCGDVLVLPPKEKRAAREQSWRAHVCQDVMPYTCFIEGCTASPEPPEMFLTSEALLAHLIEKHSSISWICDFCSSNDGVTGQSAVFESAESWGKHMDKEHGDLAKAHQRQVLADLHQQTMIGPLSCPLCDKIKTPTLDFKIDDHILGHLHEFALRALPATYEDGNDDLGSALQSRGSLSRTTNADSPEAKPVWTYFGDFGFGIGDVIVVAQTLLKHFSGMQELQSFHRLLEVVVDEWTSQTRERKESLCTHLPRLHQAINVYLEQNQPATTDINEAVLENIKNITDDVLDLQHSGQRYANWSPGETAEIGAFPEKSHQKSLGGGIWPVNAPPQSTARLTGRDKILDDLEFKLLEHRRRIHLGEKHQPQGQLRISLEGKPGVGKTAIATELARRLQAGEGCDHAIFWVDASSIASVEKAYREIYSTIVERGALMNPMHSLVYYLNWKLCDQWVMVLDGIHEQTLRYMVFQGFIPSGLNGSLLFTTRNASWQSLLGPSPFKLTIKVHRITSLGHDLREAICQTENKEVSKSFLPIDALDRIVTKERVREEIRKFSKTPYDNVDRGARLILGSSTIPGQIISRKKIFAILALIDKLETIWEVVKQGISDIHLPFEAKTRDPNWTQKSRLALLRRSTTGSPVRIPIATFHGWTDAEITSFERTQWNVHGPYFVLTCNSRAYHYVLEESVILPFIEVDEVKQGDGIGGFTDVWRVKFHPSHHDYGVLASGRHENPSFAIRRLPSISESDFTKETKLLEMLSSRDCVHIVNLLGTYEWRSRYYLIFPWADGNLLDFWRAHPEPLAPRCDINRALWFSEQCLGLVDGINSTHMWGMKHGELKPKNIMWFNQFTESTEQTLSSLGHFKISGFGLSHFPEPRSSTYTDAEDMGFLQAYQYPERVFKGKVNQANDVWSLGCVLLEFASWYLGGIKEVENFAQKRANEDTQYNGGFRQDRFFNLMKASQAMPDDNQGRTQIIAAGKDSVVQEFEKLFNDPYCSDYMVDFLELVRVDLLRLTPERRRSCAEIAGSLQKLHYRLQNDSSYGISRAKKPPRRLPTLDSILMKGEILPESKRQILEDVPRPPQRWLTDLTTIQEIPENQGQEELEQEQRPHQSETVAENAMGLNIVLDEASGPLKTSRIENVDTSAAERASTGLGLGIDHNENESSDNRSL